MHIELSVIVHKCGIVSLRGIRTVIAAPLIVGHQPLTDIPGNVVCTGGIDGGIAVHIDVGACRGFAAEYAHIVAALVVEVAVGQEHVVIALGRTGRAHILNVGSFAGYPVTACNMGAEVGIRLHCAAVRGGRIGDV